MPIIFFTRQPRRCRLASRQVCHSRTPSCLRRGRSRVESLPLTALPSAFPENGLLAGCASLLAERPPTLTTSWPDTRRQRLLLFDERHTTSSICRRCADAAPKSGRCPPRNSYFSYIAMSPRKFLTISMMPASRALVNEAFIEDYDSSPSRSSAPEGKQSSLKRLFDAY